MRERMTEEQFASLERSWATPALDSAPPPTPDDDEAEGEQFMAFFGAYQGASA